LSTIDIIRVVFRKKTILITLCIYILYYILSVTETWPDFGFCERLKLRVKIKYEFERPRCTRPPVAPAAASDAVALTQTTVYLTDISQKIRVHLYISYYKIYLNAATIIGILLGEPCELVYFKKKHFTVTITVYYIPITQFGNDNDRIFAFRTSVLNLI